MNGSSWIVPLWGEVDAQRTGGKAARLARWRQRGLPVPDGFVVTTDAWRARGEHWEAIEQAILQAWESLGKVPVAVRSSAIAEDLAHASLAGQYETFLQRESAEQVIEAVRRCWDSLEGERSGAYLARQGIDAQQGGMAVLVQAMVPAEVAGVLFTLDPQSGDESVMVVEAAWGLGGAVVSGAVQPDIYRLDAATGETRQVIVAEKTCWISPGRAEEEVEPLEGERRTARCLDDAALRELHALATRLRKEEGGHVDMEWAVAAGKVYLLQLRPVTASTERVEPVAWDRLRGELSELLAAGEGPWVRHNLGETVPCPSPLGWSVLRTFMSPLGGYGTMLRSVGFEPDEDLGSAGFLRLIGGQIYMDVGRAPRMLGRDHALRYDLARLREDPSRAASPPTVPCGTWRQRRATDRVHQRVAVRLREERRRLAAELRERDFLEFAAWCRKEQERPLPQDPVAWADLWRQREERIWGDFAARAFMATMLLEAVGRELREFLGEHFWQEDTEAVIQTLSVTRQGDAALQMAAGLYAVGCGRQSLDSWLDMFGHRGPGEMDLAAARWRERPEEARECARLVTTGASPTERHERLWREAEALEQRLARALCGAAAAEWTGLLADYRAYVPFREDAKHALMLGHDLLRRQALEAGRRLGCGADVFYLQREELFEALSGGNVPRKVISTRQDEARVWKSIHLPDFLDAERVAGLGKAPVVDDQEAWEAMVLVRGSARGKALVLTEPVLPTGTAAGFILVCPSTDTAWTPLFAQAAGLVLERGGMLSHGAIIARELGLPAVVLPDAVRRIASGAQVEVDAVHGRILVGEQPGSVASESEAGPVPPPSRREQRWQRRAAMVALVWAILLLAGWLLPAGWLAQPAMALGDLILWPVVRLVGPAAAVGVLAVATAAVTLALQRVLSDLPRLRAIKERGDAHRRLAQRFTTTAPLRARRHLAAAQSATGRVLASAMAPIGLLLGPMIGLFLWIPERLEPGVWNAAPGAVLEITAQVAGEHEAPVRLVLPDGFVAAAHTPLVRTLPPVRRTLESLQARWQSRAPDAALAAIGVGEVSGSQLLAQLQDFLSRPLPPQRLVWQVYPPQDFNGRDFVRIEAGDLKVEVPVVLGWKHAPDVRTVTAEDYPYRRTTRVAGSEPVQEAAIAYPPPSSRGVLLKVGGWEVPWLIIYLAAYLPAMFGLKRVWGIP